MRWRRTRSAQLLSLSAAHRRFVAGRSTLRSRMGRTQRAVRPVLAVACVAALMAASGLVSRAQATNYFVSAGADSCGTPRPGTRTAPYCTISAALAAHHVPGTRIFVLPGVYREQVTIPAGG